MSKPTFYGFISIFILFVLVVGIANMSQSEFEWVTTFILPWLFFIVFVYYVIVRTRKNTNKN